MICPSCGSREIGLLPAGHYYCWQCFVQFSVGETSAEVFEVEEDGTLVSLGRVGLDRVDPVSVVRAESGAGAASPWPGR